MNLLIKGGRVIDPANKLDALSDILVVDGKISQVSKTIKAAADKTIDASGKIVIPGLVDMHVHLREPGREDKETVESGTKAALRGGITTVLAMPNTSPAMDRLENINILKGIINKTAQINVLVCGAITRDRAGQDLVELDKFKKENIIAISDDGYSVDNEELMLEALQKAKEEKILVVSHCEDKKLSNGGVVNLGFTSTRLGLRGISRESEYKRIERDICLAEKVQGRIHIAHVSCKESVEVIAQAKKRGVKVTAETAPHYFSLSEEVLSGYDTNFKMNPPLRTKMDVEAIKQGLKNGVLDVIASDHAPHTPNEKEIEFDRAEFGVTGLETELAVSVTELVQSGVLDWAGLIHKLSLNPSGILGIDRGTLSKGAVADITIISPDREWRVQKEEMVSLSKNSAFIGRTLKGLVEYTIVGGKTSYINTGSN